MRRLKKVKIYFDQIVLVRAPNPMVVGALLSSITYGNPEGQYCITATKKASLGR